MYFNTNKLGQLRCFSRCSWIQLFGLGIGIARSKKTHERMNSQMSSRSLHRTELDYTVLSVG